MGLAKRVIAASWAWTHKPVVMTRRRVVIARALTTPCAACTPVSAAFVGSRVGPSAPSKKWKENRWSRAHPLEATGAEAADARIESELSMPSIHACKLSYLKQPRPIAGQG